MSDGQDAAADIEALIGKYSKSVYSFCCHLTGNRNEAEDLYQDTFLTAWEKRKSLMELLTDREEITVRNYLFGIAVNLWRNRQNKKLRRNRIAPVDGREDALNYIVDDSNNPEEEAIDRELRHVLKKQVDALPDKLKTVVVMYYTASMSTEDIADRLKIPSATVRSRLNRAKKKMQKGLKQHGYETLQ